MHLKNLKPQKTAVFCKDGTMLHLRSREEIDISKVELDKNHLDSMIAKGSMALRDKGSKSATRSEAAKPENVEASGKIDPAHKKSEDSKSGAKGK